jgi:hypothetical protein
MVWLQQIPYQDTDAVRHIYSDRSNGAREDVTLPPPTAGDEIILRIRS